MTTSKRQNRLLRHAGSALCLSALLLSAGCGGERRPQLAEVEGTLTLNGAPLSDVKVTFMPDPEKDNSGRNSTGVTDSNGRFVLIYQGPDEQVPGVSVGWNRVVLKDMVAANSSRDETPTPQRFSMEYNLPASTPLQVEVTSSASQSFKFDVK